MLKSKQQGLDDEPFLEVAIAGRMESLVTGNHGHYPSSPFKGINIFPPSEFVEFYRSQDRQTRKKSKTVTFRHSREGGNLMITSGSACPPSRA